MNKNVLFLLICLYIKLVYSQEDTCYNILFSQTLDTRYSSWTAETVCSSNIPDLQCSNGFITSMSINEENVGGARSTLAWTDFSCFSKLNSIVLYNTLLETSFLYDINRNLFSLQLRSTNIQSITNQITSQISFLVIDNLNGLIPVSYLKNIEQITSGSGSMNTNSFSFYSDSIQNDSKLKRFFIAGDTVPEVSGLNNLETCNFQFMVPLLESTLSNLDNFAKKCKTITLSSNRLMNFTFPSGWNNNESIYNKIEFDYTSNLLLNTSSYIDLSNYSNKLGSNLLYMNFLSVGNFNLDGNFPIIGFPKNFTFYSINFSGTNISSLSNLNSFKNIYNVSFANEYSFIDSGISNLPKNVFSNREVFDVSNNKIVGTLDESWCTGAVLKVKNNQLSGNLPLCYYCHLGDAEVYQRLSGNSFDNFVAPVDNILCNYKSIIPNIKFIKISNSIFFDIWGSNLGFTKSNINIFPNPQSFICFAGAISGSIDHQMNTLKLFNLTYTSLNLTYTLSISDTPPIINSIVQNNDTLLISGQFFTYNISDTIISIDNYQNCAIESTTFYQIECKLKKQIKYEGLTPVTINVKNLSTTTSNYQLKYIVYQCVDCGLNGACNTITGLCVCKNGWLNVDSYPACTVPGHYVSAVTTVSSKDGGNITLSGWFGNINNNLLVKVGDNSNCTIISNNENQIIVTIGPGSGIQTIHVIQNTVTYTGKFYPYYDSILLCPNNCTNSNQGNCIDGQCQCLNKYTGIDCSIEDNKTAPPTNITIKDGSLKLVNENTNFIISIDSVNEIDINGNIVDSWILSPKWGQYENTSSSSNNNNPLISIFAQTRNITNSSIILTLEQVEDRKQFNFANTNFTVDAGGVKFTTELINWDYKSYLNTLQIILSTSVDLERDPCVDHDDSIESSSSSSQINNNVNYLKVIKDSKVLFGRFLDKMLSDSRITTIETKILNNSNDKVVLGISLPRCNVCILDPDFQILVNPNFKSNNSCSKNRAWLLPVVIAVPVVGVSIIIVVSVIIYRKNRVRIKIGLNNISMKHFSDKSKN